MIGRGVEWKLCAEDSSRWRHQAQSKLLCPLVRTRHAPLPSQRNGATKLAT
jgi:hypothetical protein